MTILGGTVLTIEVVVVVGGGIVGCMFLIS